MKTNRTTSSGPKIPNCTLLTSRRGALESPVYAILVNEIKHNKILYIRVKEIYLPFVISQLFLRQNGCPIPGAN